MSKILTCVVPFLAMADALYYQITREAEANAQKLTPEYLRLVLYQAIANNTKIYFGESIPQIFLDWSETDSNQKQHPVFVPPVSDSRRRKARESSTSDSNADTTKEQSRPATP